MSIKNFLDDLTPDEPPSVISSMEDFEVWLKVTLNAAAYSCESYVRTNDESPPESYTQPYYALRDAWDGYQVIVHKDASYRYPVEQVFKDKGFLHYLKYHIGEKHPKQVKKLVSKLPPVEKKLYKKI